jgi:hypothetical protein
VRWSGVPIAAGSSGAGATALRVSGLLIAAGSSDGVGADALRVSGLPSATGAGLASFLASGFPAEAPTVQVIINAPVASKEILRANLVIFSLHLLRLEEIACSIFLQANDVYDNDKRS